MKLNINVILGVALCVVMLGVFGVFRRTVDSRDGWRPSNVYSTISGSSYSTASYSDGSAVLDGMGVPTVQMRGKSFSSPRRVGAPAFSYAPAYNAPASRAISSSANSTGGASGLYTTSSATMKSFGVSAATGVSMSGGAVRSTNAQSSMGYSSASMATNSFSLPMMNDQSYGNVLADVNATAQAMVSSYQGIGNTTTGGPRAMRGRRGAGPGTNTGDWLNWLVLNGYGTQGSDGIFGLDIYQLREAYDAYVAAWNSTMGGNQPPTWDEWLSWFMGSEGNPYGYTDDGGDTYTYYQFVPLGDAFALLLLALCYVLFVFLKSRLVARHAE